MPTGAVYLDDSGNPGAQSGSVFLPSSRRSWTAVIVRSSVAADVETAGRLISEGVRREFGAEELHFTDIYSGSGPWRSISPARRAHVIEVTAKVMSVYDLPVWHQTVSDHTIMDHPQWKDHLLGRVGDWDLANLSELGLLFTCFEVAKALRTLKNQAPTDFQAPFPAYADEGIMDDGRYRSLPECSDVIEGSLVNFRRSSDLFGIQLTDFAAFMLTRSQWLTVKHQTGTPVGEADSVVLRSAASLNLLNLPMRLIPAAEFGRVSYEAFAASDRVSKGLSPRPPAD